MSVKHAIVQTHHKGGLPQGKSEAGSSYKRSTNTTKRRTSARNHSSEDFAPGSLRQEVRAEEDCRFVTNSRYPATIGDEHMVYPNDLDKLDEYMRVYMQWTLDNCVPNHYSEITWRISKSSLIRYMINVVGAAELSFHLRKLELPMRNLLYAGLNTFVSILYVNAGLDGYSGFKPTFIDMAGIKDYIRKGVEAFGNSPANYAFVLQQQTSVLLTRLTTSRPGTMFTSEPIPGFTRGDLAWRHHQTGRLEFTTMIRFQNNKQRTRSIGLGIKRNINRLRARILSPKRIASLPYSVPHRLLAQAISQGVLEDVETVSDAYARDTILASPRFAHFPVIPDPDNPGTPLSVAKAGRHFRAFINELGFPTGTAHTAIRRQVATDLVPQIEQDLDLTALLMGEDVPTNGHDSMMRKASTNVVPYTPPTESHLYQQTEEAIRKVCIKLQSKSNARSEKELLTEARSIVCDRVMQAVKLRRSGGGETLGTNVLDDAAGEGTQEVDGDADVDDYDDLTALGPRDGVAVTEDGEDEGRQGQVVHDDVAAYIAQGRELVERFTRQFSARMDEGAETFA
ncbi:hypothetical protein LTR56_002037 [Elasticomyces elasticus]|nr:hypothetical protein LTR56_002037 [Elasticomyces elasticus]